MPSTTARRLLVVGVLSFATAAAAKSSQSQVTGTPAASIARELISLPFGGSMTDWRRMNQRAEWVNYPLAPELPVAEQEWILTGDWCAIGRDSNDTYSRQAIFYPYRPELPLDCRLEELRYEFRETAGRPDPYEDLSATFERQFGKPFWVEGGTPED